MNVDNDGRLNVQPSVNSICMLDSLRQKRSIKMTSIYVTALCDEEIYIEAIAKYIFGGVIGGLIETKFSASLVGPLSN